MPVTTNGYIKLHRRILKHPIITNSRVFQLFIYLLLKTNWKNTQESWGELLSGEFYASTIDTCSALSMTENQFFRARAVLLELGVISLRNKKERTRIGRRMGSIIVINKWSKYQEQNFDTGLNSILNGPDQAPLSGEAFMVSPNGTVREEELDLGYIRLYRSLAQSPIVQNPALLTVWVYSLLSATYQETEDGLGLKAGQYAATMEDMAHRTYLPHTQIKESISYLLKHKMVWVDPRSTETLTVFDLVEWNKYQYKPSKRRPSKQASEKPQTSSKKVSDKETSEKDFKNKDLNFHKKWKKRKKEKNPRSPYSPPQAGDTTEIKASGPEVQDPGEPQPRWSPEIVDHLPSPQEVIDKFLVADPNSVSGVRVRKGCPIRNRDIARKVVDPWWRARVKSRLGDDPDINYGAEAFFELYDQRYYVEGRQ